MKQPLRQPTGISAAMARVLAQHGPVLGSALIRASLRRNGRLVRTLLRISAAQPTPPQAA